jgi:hypothetical protein
VLQKNPGKENEFKNTVSKLLSGVLCDVLRFFIEAIGNASLFLTARKTAKQMTQYKTRFFWKHGEIHYVRQSLKLANMAKNRKRSINVNGLLCKVVFKLE